MAPADRAVRSPASPIHGRRRKIKPLQKRHGDLNPAAGKTVDELALRSVREVADVVFNFSGLKVHQIAREIDLWRALRQRAEAQRLLLKSRAGEIERRLRSEDSIRCFALKRSLHVQLDEGGAIRLWPGKG